MSVLLFSSGSPSHIMVCYLSCIYIYYINVNFPAKLYADCQAQTQNEVKYGINYSNGNSTKYDVTSHKYDFMSFKMQQLDEIYTQLIILILCVNCNISLLEIQNFVWFVFILSNNIFKVYMYTTIPLHQRYLTLYWLLIAGYYIFHASCSTILSQVSLLQHYLPYIS